VQVVNFDIRSQLILSFTITVPVRCTMCSRTFRTEGFLRLHANSHNGRPGQVDNVNQAPYIKDERDWFACRLCDFSAQRRQHFNRHVRKRHLRPQPDTQYHHSLWCYALAKKADGTAYCEAKKQREEALQRELDEMEFVLVNVEDVEVVQEPIGENLNNNEDGEDHAAGGPVNGNVAGNGANGTSGVLQPTMPQNPNEQVHEPPNDAHNGPPAPHHDPPLEKLEGKTHLLKSTIASLFIQTFSMLIHCR
jgi:hypothetical protein